MHPDRLVIRRTRRVGQGVAEHQLRDELVHLAVALSGEEYVEVNVEIPVNLTSKQKSILKEFEKEGGTSKSHSPKSQSFFKKIKEVWDDLT